MNTELKLCCCSVLSPVDCSSHCTYPLVFAELSAFVTGGSLREPAQYHFLLQDFQLVHIHENLSYKQSSIFILILTGWIKTQQTIQTINFNNAVLHVSVLIAPDLDHSSPVALLLQEVFLKGRQAV